MRIVVTGAGGFGGSALGAPRISPIADASASATTAAPPPISRLDRGVWRAAAPTRETPHD